jgi:protein phosphatase 2C family protein 2/3
MIKFESNIQSKKVEELKKVSTTLLPRIQRSSSPTHGNRSPNFRVSHSQKLLLPDVKNSKCSSGRTSRVSNFNEIRVSTTRCGVVYGYASNSHRGLARHKKFDCISLITSLPCPNTFPKIKWPSSSYYAIYDGHYGKKCSRFLRDHLHNNILSDENFPTKAKAAIYNAFIKTDESFISQAEDQGDMSGSCAVIVMFIGSTCIVANTGDSRCLVSCHKGTKIIHVSAIHKPDEPEENNRIIQSGGSVSHGYTLNKAGEALTQGPARVTPGKLFVSRAFGNIDAKVLKLGGNPDVVIVDPHIKSFKVNPDFDFIFLATDSLFDLMSNREIVDIIWNSLHKSKGQDLATQLNNAVEDLLNEVKDREVQKNVTIILITLKNLIENLPGENT